MLEGINQRAAARGFDALGGDCGDRGVEGGSGKLLGKQDFSTDKCFSASLPLQTVGHQTQG